MYTLFMDTEIKSKLDEQSAKIDKIYSSVEKMRKYFLVTLWVTILVIVLPLIGLVLIVPSFLNSYTTAINGN